jgi:Peptidase propeptide and YPEB domain
MVASAMAIGRRWRGGVAGLTLIALLGFADMAAARPRPLPLPLDAGSPVVAFAAQRGGISLAQATAIAQSRYPGRVVSAKTIMAGDRVVHEIRILADGRVRTVRIDAQTGSFL